MGVQADVNSFRRGWKIGLRALVGIGGGLLVVRLGVEAAGELPLTRTHL
jgi:hypothetical protein